MIAVSSHHWENFYRAHLEVFKRFNDKQAQARCPFHEDKEPSLSINLAEGLWKCHGCGEEGNALTFADKKNIPRVGIPGWEPSAPASKISATYDYKAENGDLLFQAVRFEPKAFRQRRQIGTAGDWTWDLNGTRRVLYRLPELLSAKETEPTIFFPEGEKDVETLRSHGFTATTSPMGAGKFRDEYAASLHGFMEVVIITDKDDVGRKHAFQIATALSKVVERVKVLELPGEQVKDVSDWFQAGGNASALMKIVQETKPWVAVEHLQKDSAQPQELVSCGIKFQPRTAPQLMSEKVTERVWVWDKYIPEGGLILLCGQPKAGKTTLVYHLVRAVLNGMPFLGIKTKKSSVLILAVEEHREDIAARLTDLGIANNESLHIHCAPLRSSPPELDGIKRYIHSNKIGLLIVDTLARFWNVREENAAAEVGAQLDPILDLARTSGVAVLLIHHARKSEGADGTEIRGSGDLLAAADAGLVLKPNRGSDTQRILLAYSRFPTPRELVVSLENGQYVVLGTQRHVRHEEQRKEVLAALTAGFLETDAIARSADMPAGTCRTVLSELYDDGLVDRQGEGVKGKAYSYALKSENDSAQKELLGVQNNSAPEPSSGTAPIPRLTPGIQQVFQEAEAVLNG